MPRYDFKCECGHIFEKVCEIKKIPDRNETYIEHEKWPCPKCGKLAIRQFPTGTSFEFNSILGWKKHLKPNYF